MREAIAPRLPQASTGCCPRRRRRAGGGSGANTARCSALGKFAETSARRGREDGRQATTVGQILWLGAFIAFIGPLASSTKALCSRLRRLGGTLATMCLWRSRTVTVEGYEPSDAGLSRAVSPCRLGPGPFCGRLSKGELSGTGSLG